MELRKIEIGEMHNGNKSMVDALKKLQKLVTVLEKRNLPEEILIEIDREISTLNSFRGSKNKTLVAIKTTEHTILRLTRKKLGLTSEKFYISLWLPLGMVVFGMPLGTLISSITGNVAFLSLGLPIGMVLGILVGTTLDNKAKKENRVLVIE